MAGRHPGAGPQDDEPPHITLVVKAAVDISEMTREMDRPAADIIHAIDALGRALVRLKEHLRAEQ
jgi:hypothetical protein